jgi:hypothetical protein
MVRLFLCIFFCANAVLGGFERPLVGARPAAMGGAGTGMADSVLSLARNPAGLAFIRAVQATAAFSPAPYGFRELASCGASVALPVRSGVLEFSYQRFGFEFYREQTAACSYALGMSGLSVGISLTYQSVAIKGYGSAGAVAADLGTTLFLLNGLSCGFLVTNVTAASIGVSAERLPQVYTLGAAYTPVRGCTLTADLRKEIFFPCAFLGGCEYWILPGVALRLGMKGDPQEYSGGIGLRISGFRFDYAVTVHPLLGTVQEISLTIGGGGGL